jgi:hypothetical protein
MLWGSHRSLRFALIGLGMMALAGNARLGGQVQEPAVTVKAVSYAGLGDIVRQLKGKVVVVDFWADT